MTKLSGFVEKGWGYEFIWATNDKYCGKLMHFNKNAKFSMHFHKDKHETWLILSGKFIVEYINTKDASKQSKFLEKNDTWCNEPLFPHQLFCLEEGDIIEVSTADSVEDNYRIIPGDSQN